MDEDGGPSRPNGEKKDGKQTAKSSGDRCMVMNCGTTFLMRDRVDYVESFEFSASDGTTFSITLHCTNIACISR